MLALPRDPFVVQVQLSRSSSTVAAPLANRFYLFNYFEKPEDSKVFKSFWMKGSEYVSKQDHFIATYLHNSIDPEAK